jgi:hypothetical protein
MTTTNEIFKIHYDASEGWYIITSNCDDWRIGAIVLAQNKEQSKRDILLDGLVPYGWTKEQYDNEFIGEIFATENPSEFKSKNGFYIGTYE